MAPGDRLGMGGIRTRLAVAAVARMASAGPGVLAGSVRENVTRESLRGSSNKKLLEKNLEKFLSYL